MSPALSRCNTVASQIPVLVPLNSAVQVQYSSYNAQRFSTFSDVNGVDGILPVV